MQNTSRPLSFNVCTTVSAPEAGVLAVNRMAACRWLEGMFSAVLAASQAARWLAVPPAVRASMAGFIWEKASVSATTTAALSA